MPASFLDGGQENLIDILVANAPSMRLEWGSSAVDPDHAQTDVQGALAENDASASGPTEVSVDTARWTGVIASLGTKTVREVILKRQSDQKAWIRGTFTAVDLIASDDIAFEVDLMVLDEYSEGAA